jgi:hypothetical protein
MNSKTLYRLATFVLVGILVMSIGALAGWYLVLRQKGQSISFGDAARGFGMTSPSAGENGSTFGNIGGNANRGFALGGTPGVGEGSFTNNGNGGQKDNTLDTFSEESAQTSEGTSNTVRESAASATTSTSNTLVYKTPRLWRATKNPVAGFQFATSSPSVYFADRATGYVFQGNLVSGEITRRSNTLRPKVYEALINRSGGVLYRTLNGTTGAIETFSGAIGVASSSPASALSGTALKNNITEIDANPDNKTIFYLIADNGQFEGHTQTWIPGKTGKDSLVFTSSIGSWKLFSLADGRLLVAEKPQDGVSGFAYEVLKDQSLKPVVRNAPGLTLLPLSGSKALVFGTSDHGVLTLYAQTSTTTLALPIQTVADKCVWAPSHEVSKKNPISDLVIYCAVPKDATSGNFLEDWYMGSLHTSDSWWRINLTTGKSEKIFAPEQGSASIDVVDPSIDPSGTFIGFKNHMDGTLWLLRIVK